MYEFYEIDFSENHLFRDVCLLILNSFFTFFRILKQLNILKCLVPDCLSKTIYPGQANCREKHKILLCYIKSIHTCIKYISFHCVFYGFEYEQF